MQMKRLVLLSMLAAFSLPAIGHADGDPRAIVRAACKSDVISNCGMVMGDKATACLIKNSTKLSDGCTNALKKVSCNSKAPANIKATFPCSN
jgi:hypothetical protein